MSGVLLHSVDNLIKDKRGAKIVCQGERVRVAGRVGGKGEEL